MPCLFGLRLSHYWLVALLFEATHFKQAASQFSVSVLGSSSVMSSHCQNQPIG